MTENLHNGKNIIEKKDTIFPEEEILEFFMAPTVKHTFLSWRRRFQPFNLEPDSSVCFFDGFKSRTISFTYP